MTCAQHTQMLQFMLCDFDWPAVKFMQLMTIILRIIQCIFIAFQNRTNSLNEICLDFDNFSSERSLI
jgi:hypothetical protein